jgi:hypothetical protein
MRALDQQTIVIDVKTIYAVEIIDARFRPLAEPNAAGTAYVQDTSDAPSQ